MQTFILHTHAHTHTHTDTHTHTHTHTHNVCVCLRVGVTELKNIPFELKCQTRSVLAVILSVLKRLALATFLGQANFNKVVKIVFISVFISTFLVHLKKYKVLK